MKKIAIVLAAGNGKRMNSELDIPKVAFKVMNVPMIEHVVDTLEKLNLDEIIVVIGYRGEKVTEILKNRVKYVRQDRQLGTADAVKCAINYVKEDDLVLVLCGDTPLIETATLEDLINHHQINNNDMTVMTTNLTTPTGYGRIIRFDNRIVEEKDALEEEKKISEVNTGIYGFKGGALLDSLSKVTNNNSQNEYYLTDMVSIIFSLGGKVGFNLSQDAKQFFGVNDKIQLSKVNSELRNRINRKLMTAGVTIIDSNTTYIGKNVIIEKDVEIWPGAIILGDSRIGKNCLIGPNCRLSNVIVKANTTIEYSIIEGGTIGSNCQIGPYARLRESCHVADNSKVGNFVEMKNVAFGAGSKSAHLTYLGDASIGSDVNIGCGVITANFDGKNKHKTKINNNSSIGSNVTLIAPITVGRNSIVAAGSTLTEDVSDGDLAIARSYQTNKRGLGLKKTSK